MRENKEHPVSRPIEVLIVDDDLVDIKLTRRELERDQTAKRVHVVRDGVEAIRFLRGQADYKDAPRPDLVLLDLNMPLKDGREVLDEIKADASLKEIPVVIFSSSDAPSDIVGSYRRHANSYVTKPVEVQQFRQAIMTLSDYWCTVVSLPRAASLQETW